MNDFEKLHPRDPQGKFKEKNMPSSSGVELTDETDYSYADLKQSFGIPDETYFTRHLSLHEGSSTPWGPAQNVVEIAPGFYTISTASHGGIKLSAERNRFIPEPLRNKNGWYEEDCDANIPVMFYTEAWSKSTYWQSYYKTEKEIFDDAAKSLKYWYPDEFEQATGWEVKPGESAKRDLDNWIKENEDLYIATYEKPYKGVIKLSHGEKKYICRVKDTPDSECHKALGYKKENVEILTEIIKRPYQKVVKPKAKIKIPKTENQQWKVQQELGEIYRNHEGRVRTLAERINEEGGVVDKAKYGRKYYISTATSQRKSQVIPVSKTLYDCFVISEGRSYEERREQAIKRGFQIAGFDKFVKENVAKDRAAGLIDEKGEVSESRREFYEDVDTFAYANRLFDS